MKMAGTAAERQESGVVKAINDAFRKNKRNPFTVAAGNTKINNVVGAKKFPGRQATGSEPYTDVILQLKNKKDVNLSLKGEAAPSLAGGGLRGLELIVPGIANRFMKAAYDKLIEMGLKAGDKVPGNHARRNPNGSGMYNQREIDEIKNILKDNDSKNIGIISPFRYQANLITDKYATDRIEADTIHKFQGRQKEEVILSFVVNSLEKDPNNVENRLYDFVTNDKLLNVAISRGKNKVTAVVADKVYHSSNNAINDFIKYSEYLYCSEITRESTVTSVFDVLYSEYSNILLTKYKERPNDHKTELLMCDLINEVLKDYGYIGYSMHTRLGNLINVPDTFSAEEKKYILHPLAHVDFLFFNKVSKEKLFVLEVDGIKYHEQDKKQAEHDKIKDWVLQSNNIPIYRFKTNESNEKQRLIDIIKEFSH